MRMVSMTGHEIEPVILESHSRTLFGRSPKCEICLPDARISRRHFAVLNQDGQWCVIDLGSRHGTFLNGMQIEPHKPIPTDDGDLIRAGPFVFRLDWGGGSHHIVATTFDAVESNTIVQAVPAREYESIAHQRLSVLLEGCTAIYQSLSEVDLAQAVVRLTATGTGFPRAAMLRWSGSPDDVEIVAYQDYQHDTADGFRFSKSLLMRVMDGGVARLSHSSEGHLGQSIERLGIVQAMCAPLVVDGVVIGAIYLDSRDGEISPQSDAASFCHAVSQFTSLALSSLKRVELTRRQALFDADMKVAQEAQSLLLPAYEGQVGGLRYASRRQSGSEVGGDLFDIFEIDERRTGICFGDITGHGVGAAILMTAVLSHLRALLLNCGDPAVAVSEANAYLVDHSSDRMFATLWVGVFDAESHRCGYVDAGHGHWLVCTGDKPPVRPESTGGLIIGVDSESEYSTEYFELREGDRLVLYSDGLVEQPNTENIQFGSTRLQDIIAGSCSIHDDIDRSFTALEKFAGNCYFADDTMIASIEVGVE